MEQWISFLQDAMVRRAAWEPLCAARAPTLPREREAGLWSRAWEAEAGTQETPSVQRRVL